MNDSASSSGRTLFQVTLVVTLVFATAAIVVPFVGRVREDGAVAALNRTLETLERACERYATDTGRCSREYGTSASASHHTLSRQPPGMAGWKGPYLAHPLSDGSSSFGGYINVYDDLSSSNCSGFDLDGDGEKDATGPGNFVRLSNVPEELAAAFDAVHDRSVPGDWRLTGRVQWRSGKLDVFLLELPPR